MRILIASMCCLFLFAAPLPVKAQDDQSTIQKVKKGVKKDAHDVKKGVKKGAHEVAEQASEAKSDITDKEVENKMGPNGEDIFLEDDGRYYYVDEKGHRVYMNASDLRNKPPKPGKD